MSTRTDCVAVRNVGCCGAGGAESCARRVAAQTATHAVMKALARGSMPRAMLLDRFDDTSASFHPDKRPSRQTTVRCVRDLQAQVSEPRTERDSRNAGLVRQSNNAMGSLPDTMCHGLTRPDSPRRLDRRGGGPLSRPRCLRPGWKGGATNPHTALELRDCGNVSVSAVAVSPWLAENGWNDFFLDISPERSS